MKTLLLIPSVLKTGIDQAVAQDRHPRMDYYALADALRGRGDEVELLDYGALERAPEPLVRLFRRVAGRDAALALLGLLRGGTADALFTNGENIGIPLALLLRLRGKRRPGHVTIGHRLSTGKKRLFFGLLGVHREMDALFVYATTQRDFGRDTLGIPEAKLRLIPFHADSRFFRPLPDATVHEDQISSAGLEWRDYPTLIDAVADMPAIRVKLAAASPWSKHTNETEGRQLPAHVDARRYEYDALRQLYAESGFVVVPLYENDFQAGVTTLLEAMATGKAVIVTKTTGQTDVVVEGENGLTVSPGDTGGWRRAIQRLRDDSELRERLGRNARRWIEENATLERWVGAIADAVHQSAEAHRGASHVSEARPSPERAGSAFVCEEKK